MHVGTVIVVRISQSISTLLLLAACLLAANQGFPPIPSSFIPHISRKKASLVDPTLFHDSLVYDCRDIVASGGHSSVACPPVFNSARIIKQEVIAARKEPHYHHIRAAFPTPQQGDHTIAHTLPLVKSLDTVSIQKISPSQSIRYSIHCKGHPQREETTRIAAKKYRVRGYKTYTPL
jgi:hypothetical protein